MSTATYQASDATTPSQNITKSSVIRKLNQDVVNRIAAGEVIHRPANALKEMLENALDAGATQISVTVAQGGLKLLQIQDNGKGIHQADMEIVCERFTTSKLKAYEDLQKIESFGFRGEALASISHVAHVTITSKTSDQPCAYKAQYRDGKMITQLKPCAGKNGTQIIVEDLFYNLSTRKQALKNTSEQYQKILQVMQKYAIHYGDHGVKFICKRHRETLTDLNTTKLSTTLDVIKTIYGPNLARELIPINISMPEQASVLPDDSPNSSNYSNSVTRCSFNVSLKGFMSNANFSQRKSQFILFINNRLVDCPALKRACDYIYSLYLPKQTHAFMYFHLQMPTENVDVNVHPTKAEVQFLEQEDIINWIVEKMESKLKTVNVSRTFTVQPITASMVSDSTSVSPTKKTSKKDLNKCNTEDEMETEINNKMQSIEVDLSKKTIKKTQQTYAPQRLVRTDHKSTTLDSFVYLSQSTSQSMQAPSDMNMTENNSSSKKRKYNDYSAVETSSEPESEIILDQEQLTSVENILNSIQKKTSNTLTKLFREHTFVGVVNAQYSLIQYSTKLYLINHTKVFYEYFYQSTFIHFSKFIRMDGGTIQFPYPYLSVKELILEAFSSPLVKYDDEDGPRDQVAQEIASLLLEKSAMLADYFGMEFDIQTSAIKSIPILLKNHEPSFHALPEFLLELATEVNWNEEEQCFDHIAKAIAKWYSISIYPTKSNDEITQSIQYVLYPALKTTKSMPFLPSYKLNDAKIVTEIACLSNLYKIFERC